MALMINDTCIACGACEAECPVEAISEGDDGLFHIDPEVCVECQGYADSPQCAAVCPTDSCVPRE